MTGPRDSAVIVAAGVLAVAAGCSAGPPGPSIGSNVASARPSATATAESSAIAPRSLTASASPAGVAPPPIGRIAFQRQQGGPEGSYLGTFVLDASGTETEVDISGPHDFAAPLWSPDARRLFINAWNADSGPSLGVVDVATRAYTAVEPIGYLGEFECTDWQPSGDAVVCGFAGPNADEGLVTIAVPSGTVSRLTRSPFHHVSWTDGFCGGGDSRGVFSPDGTRMAFIRQRCDVDARSESASIVVAAADGTGEQTIVDFGGVRTHPGSLLSWSSDGERIAFGSQGGQLWVVAPDGTGPTELDVFPGRFVQGPTWSPDSAWIALSVSGETDDLYAVSADGTRTIRLTDSPPSETFADWAE